MTDNVTNELSPKDATNEIRSIAKLGTITPSWHVLNDHPDRNYDMTDLELILSKGEVKEPPEYDTEYDSWKYKVKGNTVEGDEATAVVVFESNREIFCVTIMDK